MQAIYTYTNIVPMLGISVHGIVTLEAELKNVMHSRNSKKNILFFKLHSIRSVVILDSFEAVSRCRTNVTKVECVSWRRYGPSGGVRVSATQNSRLIGASFDTTFIYVAPIAFL